MVSNVFGFIENIRNEEELLHFIDEDCNILKHNDNLYFVGYRTISQYSIDDESGELEFITKVQRNSLDVNHSYIRGDSLYCASKSVDSNTEFIKVYDLSNNTIEFAYEDQIPSGYGIVHFQIHENFYSYSCGSDPNLYIFNRNTDDVHILQNGYMWDANDSLLVNSYYDNDTGNTILKIFDFNDKLNPLEIKEIITNEDHRIVNCIFTENLIYILSETGFIILDISDLENINLLSHVTNVPYNDSYYNPNNGVEIIDNQLIFTDPRHYLWVYDISDLSNPTFVKCHLPSENGRFYKASLEYGENGFIYFTDKNRINQIPISSLVEDELEVVNAYGETGFLQHRTYLFDNWFICSKGDKNYMFNTDITDCEPIVNDFRINYAEYFEDLSTMVTIDSHGHLKIMSLNDRSIQTENEYTFDDAYYKVTEYNDYLFVSAGDGSTNKVYRLHSDYTLEHITDLDLSDGFFIAYSERLANLEYIPVRNLSVGFSSFSMKFLDNEPPFQELATTTVYGAGIDFLSEDLVSCRYQEIPNVLGVKVGHYEFPFTFDYFSGYINTEKIYRNSDYFVEGFTNSYTDGLLKFTKVTGDSYNTLLEYQFPYHSRNAILTENRSQLYVPAKNAIYRYDCDYTEVDNEDNIIESKPHVLSNYPNPFTNSTNSRNSGTNISFSTEKRSDVKISVYNSKGQKVKTLTNENYDAGEHSVFWNGKNESNHKVASGVYLYRMNVDGKVVKTNKCLVVK
jgi:hypothetical protein